MVSQAAFLHTMVGELREDLQVVLAASGEHQPAETARGRLVDIVELAGRSAPVTRAAGHVADAVDRILKIQAEARLSDAPHGDEQSARAVNLLADPLAELSAAVHRLP